MKVWVISIVLMLVGIKACPNTQPFSLTSTSPNEVYEVGIREGKDSMIYWEASKKGVKLVNSSTIPFNSPPPFFGEVYNTTKWVEESILRIGGQEKYTLDQCDEILLHNNTAGKIKALMVSEHRKQTLLIFDLVPFSKTKISVQPIALSEPNMARIDVKAYFEDGKELSVIGNSFPNTEGYTGRLHFCVEINNDQLSVNSRELDGEYKDMSEMAGEIVKRKTNSVEGLKEVPRPKIIKIPKGQCK